MNVTSDAYLRFKSIVLLLPGDLDCMSLISKNSKSIVCFQNVITFALTDWKETTVWELFVVRVFLLLFCLVWSVFPTAGHKSGCNTVTFTRIIVIICYLMTKTFKDYKACRRCYVHENGKSNWIWSCHSQVKLYEDFAKSRAKRSLEETVHDAEKKDKKVTSSGTSHIFQVCLFFLVS